MFNALWCCHASACVAFVVALLAGCAVSDKATTNDPAHATVSITSGLVRGKVINDGTVRVFKGIPYAAPPVGELRWKPPRAPAPWTGVRDAFEAASPCPQTGRLASVNEDCLHVHVWAPNKREQQKLPVMVFIHGGGQTSSAAHEYNADWLVMRGTPVVYVSMHYRLNIFAFLAHAALSAEERDLGSGNYAALDQIHALKWVRDNIAAFGGDPNNVTIFGESGGAQAVCILLASPPARGLFHRAISQSGPCQWQYYPSLAASEARGADIAAELGCKDANPMPCLRALPAKAVLAKAGVAQTDNASAQPAWGGGVFPLPMREAIASGRFHRVPLMQGSTRDEAMYHLTARYDGVGKPVTAAQYPQLIGQFLGKSRVAAVLERYPLASHASPIHALGAVLSDASMITNNRIGLCNLELANQIAAPHVPVYAYSFADGSAPYPLPIFGPPGNVPGAGHTKELSYLFNQNPLTPAQRRIADMMIGYWTNFAATGDPNGHGLPAWPVYRNAEPRVMTFEAQNVYADAEFNKRHQCQFWAEQGFARLSGPYPRATSSGAVHE